MPASSAQTSSTHCHWLSSIYISGTDADAPVLLSDRPKSDLTLPLPAKAPPLQFVGIFHSVPHLAWTVILTQYSNVATSPKYWVQSWLLSEKLVRDLVHSPLSVAVAIIPERILTLDYWTQSRKLSFFSLFLFCFVFVLRDLHFQRWLGYVAQDKPALFILVPFVFSFFCFKCHSAANVPVGISVWLSLLSLLLLFSVKNFYYINYIINGKTVLVLQGRNCSRWLN